jgi:hypothetical protein
MVPGPPPAARRDPQATARDRHAARPARVVDGNETSRTEQETTLEDEHLMITRIIALTATLLIASMCAVVGLIVADEARLERRYGPQQ